MASHLVIPRRTRQGYLLFEVMMALMIFGIIAGAMTIALNRIIDLARYNQEDNMIRIGLQSKLAEIRKQPLNLGKETEKVDAWGVTYEREVRLMELRNQKNENLSNLYRVTIRAQWTQDNQPAERTAELYVYQP